MPDHMSPTIQNQPPQPNPTRELKDNLSTGGYSTWPGRWVPWPGPAPDRRGTPITGQEGIPSSLGQGYRHPALDGGTPSSLGRGTPIRGLRVAPIQEWGYPPHPDLAWDGVPPLSTTEGVLAMWRSVCLLRSCRRTLLLSVDYDQ